MREMWEDVAYEVGAALDGYVTPQYERLARAVLRGLRLNAERRAIRAFVQNSGMLEAYHTDPELHYAVDVIARTMVGGIFDETVLTDAEMRERVKSLDTMFDALKERWPKS